jgi:hypothetical protein
MNAMHSSCLYHPTGFQTWGSDYDLSESGPGARNKTNTALGQKIKEFP